MKEKDMINSEGGGGGATTGTGTFTKKMIDYLVRKDIHTALQSKIIDPILDHIMQKIFPYIILICVLFVLLLISVLLTLGIIIFQLRANVGGAVLVNSTPLSSVA